MTQVANTLPRAFIWRRVHSLMGLFIVLFLIEHLLTNSQAALWMGENGQGFVRMVNWLHNLPYLQLLEVTLIGIPLLVHAILGIKVLFTAKANSFASDGSKPSLPEYERNKAYSWQRITSWILLITLSVHVVKFRFVEYPDFIEINGTRHYFVSVTHDEGLPQVAKRLQVELFNPETLTVERPEIMEKTDLQAGEVLIETPNFGTAVLFTVRETFKSYLWCIFYTLFVLAATFHACNGLWTFLITWGFIFRYTAQRALVKCSYGFMLLLTFLGLMAVWGTYWINLKS